MLQSKKQNCFKTQNSIRWICPYALTAYLLLFIHNFHYPLVVSLLFQLLYAALESKPTNIHNFSDSYTVKKKKKKKKKSVKVLITTIFVC